MNAPPRHGATISAVRPNWAHVAVFYGIACALSWPLFWWRWAHATSWAAWRPPVPKHLLYMWGPGVAALIAMALFRRTHRRQVTLWGGRPGRSLAFWSVPLAALVIVHLPELIARDQLAIVPALFVVGFLATLGEELGWRGFLQDSLRPMGRIGRYLTIGLLWELWHFTTRWGEKPVAGIVLTVTVMALVASVLSWVIGEATDRARSVAVAVTLHAWVNLSFEAAAMFGAPLWRTGLVGAAAIAFWIWQLRTWPQDRAGEPATVGEAEPLHPALEGDAISVLERES